MFRCTVSECNNLSCNKCIGEISVMMNASLASSTSSASQDSKHVQFEAPSSSSAPGQPVIGQLAVNSDGGRSEISSIPETRGDSVFSPGKTVRVSRVPAVDFRMPGIAQRSIRDAPGLHVHNEKEMALVGAPPGGWDTTYTKVKDVQWKSGERISEETWLSLEPRVARDLYYQLGSNLYALLTVWLGGAFQVLVESVPNDDGFGL